MKKYAYSTTSDRFTDFKEKNLSIRHNIADILNILPQISGPDRQKFEEFFKFTEKLEKRVYFNNINEV